MTVFGIGAYYDDVDVSSDFISKECACIGWGKTEPYMKC